MQLFKPPWVTHDGNPILSIDIHPDGTRFATGGQDGDAGRVSIWNMVPLLRPETEDSDSVPKLLCHMDNHLACVNSVRWSGSGRWLASAGDDKIIMIWHLMREAPRVPFGFGDRNHETWRVNCVLHGHQGDVLDLAWSSRDEYIASCSVDNTAIVWDARNWGDKIAVLKGHSGMVKGVAWDPVGKFLASQSDDKTLMIWRCLDWKCQKVISEPFKGTSGATHMLRLHWSPDGQLLVSAHAKNGNWPTAQIIKRDGLEEFNDFVGHRKAVTCVRFNPQMLTTADEDVPLQNGVAGDHPKENSSRSLNGNDVDAHAHVHEEKPPKKKKKSDEFTCCAIGSRDHGISIWLTRYQRPRVVVGSLFSDSVTDLSWSRSGRELMACSWDGTVAFMSFDVFELGRPLSPEAKVRLMKKHYGNFGMEDFDASKPLFQTHVMENPLAEGEDLVKFGSAFSDGYRGSMMDVWSPNSYAPSKPVIRGPTDKQIETRTKDGRRRITPVFIPMSAELADPAELTNNSATSSAFTMPDAEVEVEKAAKPEVNGIDHGKPKKRAVEAAAKAKDGGSGSRKPVKEDEGANEESSSDSESSSSSSSSSSDSETSSDSSSGDEAEEDGDGTGDEGDEEMPEAAVQEQAQEVEEDGKEKEAEEESTSSSDSSSESDSDSESSSSDDEAGEENGDASAEVAAEAPVPMEQVASGEGEADEDEAEDDDSDDESDDGDEAEEEPAADSPAPGEAGQRKRKRVDSDDEEEEEEAKEDSAAEQEQEAEPEEEEEEEDMNRGVPRPKPMDRVSVVNLPSAKRNKLESIVNGGLAPSAPNLGTNGPPPSTSGVNRAETNAFLENRFGRGVQVQAVDKNKISLVRSDNVNAPEGKPGKHAMKIQKAGLLPGVTVEAENSVYSSVGKTVHRLKCFPDNPASGMIRWDVVLGSSITNVTLSHEVVAVACANGTLHCFRTGNGEYLVAPIMLNGPVVKMFGRQHYVALVTEKCEFSLWNFRTMKSVLRCDITYLMAGLLRPGVAILTMTDTNIPVVGVTSGRAYLYSFDLSTWVLIWDSEDTVRDLAHPSALRGPVAAPGSKRPWGFDQRELPPLLAIQEQLKRSVYGANRLFRASKEFQESGTISYLHGQMAAAVDIGSAVDYKECLASLIRYCTQLALETRLRQIFDDLLGPVLSGNAADGWKSSVIGMDKRELAKEMLPLVGANLRLQRLYSEYLDLLNTANKGKAKGKRLERGEHGKAKAMVNGPTDPASPENQMT